LFGFGFGLSYSTFEYSDIRAERSPAGVTVSARVRNISARDGDEVVQLYAAGGGAGDPIRELKGFRRVHLRAGAGEVVQFTVPAADLPGTSALTLSICGGHATAGARHVS